MISITGNCSDVIYHRLVHPNKINLGQTSPHKRLSFVGSLEKHSGVGQKPQRLDHVRRIYLPQLGGDGHFDPNE